MYDHIIFHVCKSPNLTSGHKWNGLSAWWLQMATLIFLKGLCGWVYIWVNILGFIMGYLVLGIPSFPPPSQILLPYPLHLLPTSSTICGILWHVFMMFIKKSYLLPSVPPERVALRSSQCHALLATPGRCSRLARTTFSRVYPEWKWQLIKLPNRQKAKSNASS